MGLKCKIKVNTYGKLVPTTEDGKVPSIFEEALSLTGSRKEALNIWATSESENFKEVNAGAVNLDSIRRYLETTRQLKSKLTNEEVLEVRDIMSKNNIETLEGLVSKMKDIFFNEGEVSFSNSKAVSSGLYTREDLKDLSIIDQINLIDRLEGHTLTENIQEIPSDEDYFWNTGEKNMLGASKKITEQEITRELLEIIQDDSTEEIERGLSKLEYSQFLEKYSKDQEFAESFVTRFKNLVRVPKVEIKNGRLVKTTGTLSEIVANLRDDQDTTRIEAYTELVSEIDEYTWNFDSKKRVDILNKAEKEFADVGVDIIGIKDTDTSQTDITGLLRSAILMLEKPSKETIERFSEIKDEVLRIKNKNEITRLDNNTRELSIVKLDTGESLKNLFDNFGLIKIGVNTYHKVNQNENVAKLYKTLLSKVVDGDIQIPEIYDPKQGETLDDKMQLLEAFIVSRDTGVEFMSEAYSLYQVLFKHPVVENKQSLELVETVKTNEDYLKGDFVSDFYKYVLEQKQQNSNTYNKILKHFSFSATDITASLALTTIDGIEYQQELEDYFKLKKDSNVKRFFNNEGLKTLKNIAVNDPAKISEYSGQVGKIGTLIVTPPSSREYIKKEGEVFFKVGENEMNAVYSKVIPNTDPVYYTGKQTIAPYTSKQVESLLATQNMKAVTDLTTKDLKRRRELSGASGNFQSTLKNNNNKASVKVNKVFENNLVEFIRQKGIKVITNPTEYNKALNKIGREEANQNVSVLSTYFKNPNTATRTVIGNKASYRLSQNSTRIKNPAQFSQMFRREALSLENKLRRQLGVFFQPNYLLVDNVNYTIELRVPISVVSALRDSNMTNEDIIERENIVRDVEEKFKAKETEEEIPGVIEPRVEEYRDLGYEFMESSTLGILGFEYEGDIYLDESKLNNVTTLHELTHVYQTMIELRSRRGDSVAKNIMSKRKELFSDVVKEWVEYHNTTSKDNTKAIEKSGADLSSPVYAQRTNEPTEIWENRLAKEIEAYLVGPIAAERLKSVEKSKGFLGKVSEYISQLKIWINSQIGLTDRSENISTLTKAEYLDALGVSILKDSYSKDDIINESTNEVITLDSRFEILSLPNEQDNSATKIDDCGG